MNKLFLEVSVVAGKYFTTVESYISLFIYKLIDCDSDLTLHLINTDNKRNNVEIKFNDLKYKFYAREIKKPDVVETCRLPILYVEENTIISGLCSVCRGIIKIGVALESTNEFFSDLLGFKTACLLSPTESSMWTKFCEVDIINCVETILHAQFVGRFVLPDEIAKFECHVSQPIRAHNIYKLARDLARTTLNETNTNSNDKGKEPKEFKIPRINKKKKKPENRINSVSLENLEHKYSESTKMTLADVILFLCYNLIFSKLDPIQNDLDIPLTMKWYNLMICFKSGELSDLLASILVTKSFELQAAEIILNKVESFSLYKSDPKRYKPKNRIFTKQPDIENALKKIQQLNLEISSTADETPGRRDLKIFTWDDIPYDALPEGGKLPESRLVRKKEQLQSLIVEVVVLSKPGDVIVDFCSGTGHLGILLAYKLPTCKIVILENKEESLNIAKSRSKKLNLTNVVFCQSNLDYFRKNFNLGTSLHACGVATDIVLQLCISKNANFVSSPCCYGKILQMPHITYPRSSRFQTILAHSEYIFIAHCADQNHDTDLEKCNIEKSRQGEYCMDIIDTDRKLNAIEHGYKVILTRMTPEKCSPKNRLLIGMKQ